MIIEYTKNIGESMQDVVDRFKNEYKINKKEKVAFAGRLDPLAFGKIRLLIGADTKKMDEECSLDKIYSYSVIHSFQTDTYDVLGLITKNNIDTKFTNHNLIFDTERLILQPYPPFSSKTVEIDGKMVRLWFATKNNMKIPELPTKEVKIFYNKKLGEKYINGKDLLELITNLVNKVKGDFRQDETLETWEKNIDKEKEYLIEDFETKISSGGYVRSIANSMGGVALNICRKEYLD
jgi:tRNA U55 pseudouridine synthase TruB